MAKHGMLESSDLDEGSDNLEEEAASAMLVTPKMSVNGVQPEDYHDTLDGEKFAVAEAVTVELLELSFSA